MANPVNYSADLTTGTDDVVFPLPVAVPFVTETVEGLIDTTPGSTDSTYTVGDILKGVGETTVKIAVDGTASGTAALAKLSGIAAVDFNMETTKTLTVPASDWTGVQAVNVTGLAGSVDLQDFNQTSGPISLSIKTTGTAQLSATGNVDGLKYTADVGQAKGAGSVATFGASGVKVTAAADANVDLKIFNSAEHAGAITVGNVTVIAASKAAATVSINNHATATDADASAGNVKVGNVTMQAATGAAIAAHIGNKVDVVSGLLGNATAGNVTLGNVSLKGAVTLTVSNDIRLGIYKGTDVGNVTAGNITVGNVSVQGAAGLAIHDTIDTYGKGNASVGSIHIGNVAAVASSASAGVFALDLARAAEKGNATAGNVSAGNVSLTAKGSGSAYATLYLQAFAIGTAGNAVAGNLSAGNVTMAHVAAANSGGADLFELSNNVIADGGNATAGTVTVGNISINPGGAASQTAVLDKVVLYNTVQAKDGGLAAAGKMTIGSVTANVGLSGDLSFLADVEDVGKNAANKTGLVKVGNVAVDGATGAKALIDIYNVASTKLFKSAHSIMGASAAGVGTGTAGGISIGNVALTAGASGSAQLNVKEYAGTVGAVTIGNVTLNAPNIALEVLNEAQIGNAGNMKVGNVTLKGNDSTKAVSATSATHANFIENIAKSGSAGAITVGSVTVSAGANQTNALTIADEALTKAGGITLGNVNLTAGAKGVVDLKVLNSAANVGNLSAGNVSVNIAAKGNATISIANHATVSNGVAIDGNVKVGNIDMKAAASASILAHIGNYADFGHLGAVTGSATVGNVTVGNVSLEGHITLYVSNYARLGKYKAAHPGVGDVSAGNMTVGNISVQESAGFAGYNQEDAYGKGSATVGNIHVGNIAAAATDATGGVFLIDLARAAVNGDAIAGSLSAGNISLAAHGSGSAYATMYLQAFAIGTAGNAKDGNISVGNVTMTHVAGVTSGGADLFELSNNVLASKGNATAGNMTVGNISINPGGASGVGQTGVDDKVILFNTVQARAGGLATSGKITIGSVTGEVGLSGALSFFAENEDVGANVANTTGLVKVGNVTLDGLAAAHVSIDIYNVDSTKLFSSKPFKNGNVLGHAGAGAGTANGITVGNVALTAGASGSAQLNVKEYAGTVGAVTIGNVTLDAPKIALEVLNDAKIGNAGNMKVGNVTLTGNDSAKAVSATSATHANFIENIAQAGSAGSLSVGNVSLSAGAGQTDALNIADEALTTAGTVTLDNVNLVVHNTNAGTQVAKADLDIHTTAGSGGNIKVGNITVAATGATLKSTLGATNMHASVTVHSAQGSVTVGNIKVSGGVVSTAGQTLDNLGNLTGWMHLSSGSGHITVGNIDYSGYLGGGDTNTIIDVSQWAGAKSIIGAIGGSTIDDNAGQNTINVSDSTQADNLYFSTTQTAVTDANVTAGTTVQANVDKIVGFHSGDSIAFTHGAQLGGNGTIMQGGSVSWASFLSTAAADIHGGADAYSATVSGNTYVALNNNNKVVEIVEVTGVHTLTDTGHVLHWAS